MKGPEGLEAFAGDWLLSRSITSPMAGGSGEFEGRASLTPCEDGLRYVETGELKLEGAATLRAERRHLWRREGAEIAVHFDDGRLFHRMPPLGGAVRHHCPPDVYDGFYDFGGWPGFTLLWRVTGPRKSYVSHSIYRRAAASRSDLLRQ